MSSFKTLIVLALNAVPAYGVYGAGWSSATGLALYWLENAIGTALTAGRIAFHQRATGKRGHMNGGVMRTQTSDRSGRKQIRTERITFLRSFLIVAIPFTLAHGMFLAMLLVWVFPQNYAVSEGIDWDALRIGGAVTAVLMASGFLVDLIGIRDHSFAWIRDISDVATSRMIVVHLTIVIGAGLMAYTGRPTSMFWVFVVLKTMVDLGSVLPQYDPESPPRGLVATMGRLGKPGEFEAHWRAEKANDRRKRQEDELEEARH